MARFIESLDGLMGRILDLDAKKVDLVADTSNMRSYVNGGQKVRLTAKTSDTEVETFALNEHMRGQIATDLSIPKRYFDRMVKDAPQLAVTNVNHWLTEEPNRRMIRGYREEAGLVGRAWVSPSYRRLDHIEIARTLLPEFEGIGAEFHQAAISDTKLYLRALFPGMQREVKVGDPVSWGVEIRNSEVGSGSLTISGFIYRLVCKNGMTTMKALNVRHVGKRIDEDGLLSDETLRADDTAFWLAARDILKGTIAETRFEEIVSTLKDTVDSEPIARPVKATEILQKQYSLTDEEREHVLTHLITGGDLSKWGALNALTAAAKSCESVDRQIEMEGMGWDMALVPAKTWESVARAS